MANFGLSLPIIAKLNTNTGKYSDSFKCGKAINTSIVPNYATGELWADNGKVEDVKEFKDATVTLGVNTMPENAAEVIFGHTVKADGSISEKTTDTANYVGYGFVAKEINEGKTQYRGCILLKVKFQEGEESYNTKGGNITFNTPTLSGSAVPIGVGDDKEEWKIKSPFFDTEKEAYEWIEEFFIDTSEKPVKGEESESGGETGTGGLEQEAE